MKAIVQGRFIEPSSYHSKKNNKDIPCMVLYDGRDAIRVENVPPDLCTGLKPLESVDVPVMVYNGQYGQRLVYDGNAL